MADNSASAKISISTELLDNFGNLEKIFKKKIKPLEELATVDLQLRTDAIEKTFNDSTIKEFVAKIQRGLKNKAFQNVNTTGIDNIIVDTLIGEKPLSDKQAIIKKLDAQLSFTTETIGNLISSRKKGVQSLGIKKDFQSIVNENNFTSILDDIYNANETYALQRFSDPEVQAKIISEIINQYSSDLQKRIEASSSLFFYRQQIATNKKTDKNGNIVAKNKDMGKYLETDITKVIPELNNMVKKYQNYWGTAEKTFRDGIYDQGIKEDEVKRFLSLIQERDRIRQELFEASDYLEHNQKVYTQNKAERDELELQLMALEDKEDYGEAYENIMQQIDELEPLIKAYEQKQQFIENLRYLLNKDMYDKRNALEKQVENQKNEVDDLKISLDGIDKESENYESLKTKYEQANTQLQNLQLELNKYQTGIDNFNIRLSQKDTLSLDMAKEFREKFGFKTKSLNLAEDEGLAFIKDYALMANNMADQIAQIRQKAIDDALTSAYNTSLNMGQTPSPAVQEGMRQAVRQIVMTTQEAFEQAMEDEASIENSLGDTSVAKPLSLAEKLFLDSDKDVKIFNDKIQKAQTNMQAVTNNIRQIYGNLNDMTETAARSLVGPQGEKDVRGTKEAGGLYFRNIINDLTKLEDEIKQKKQQFQTLLSEEDYNKLQFNPDMLLGNIEELRTELENRLDVLAEARQRASEIVSELDKNKKEKKSVVGLDDTTITKITEGLNNLAGAFEKIQGTFDINEQSLAPLITNLQTILDLLIKISSAEGDVAEFEYITGVGDSREKQKVEVTTLKGLVNDLSSLKEINPSILDELSTKIKGALEGFQGLENISLTPETFQPLIDGINKVIDTLDAFIKKYEIVNNTLHTMLQTGLFGESLFKDIEETPKLDLLRSNLNGEIGFYSGQIENEITGLKSALLSLPKSTIDINALELLLKKIGEVSTSLEKINVEWKDAFNASDLINTFNKISNGLDTIINKLTTLQESGGIKQVISQIDFASLQNSEDFKKIVQGTPIPTSEKIRNQIKDLLIEQAKGYMQSYIFDPKELALDPKKLGDFIRRTRGEAINKYGKLYDTPALITKAMSGAGFHSKDPKTEFHIESSKELVNDRINLALGQFARSDKGINILVEQLKEYQEALDNTITQRKELSKMIDSETTIKNMLPEDIKSKAEEISQALHNMYSEGKQGTKEYLAAQIELERLLKQSVINFGDGSSKKGMELLGAENIKDAETKLVEFWQSQGSAFDDFSMKFTDYYTNLYDTVNPNKLSNMQDMVVKGLGFMGSSGTSGFNLFEDITQKTEELKFVIDYINENYQQINEAAERLVQFGKLNTEQAQQQAQAEEQVANATERAAEAQTNVARENPDGSISNPNVDSNPQIKVEFDNDSVINVVEELGTLTDYINNQFSNLPPIRVNLNPDSMADINTQITALIQTFDGNRDIPIEVHLNYDNTSVERINEIINQINNQFNNVISIQIEVNPESLTNAQNQITDFVSNIVNYTHIPLEISLDYNAASVEHAYLVAETIVSELNQQFAQVEISPQITVDGSHIVINGNQPPVVPINTPAEPQIESPISPAVVNEVKEAEQQIREEIQTTNEAVKYEWELFNEPTGQLSFFENLAEKSTEATNIVTENLNKIKSNMLDIEGQITLDDFREEQKRAQYEHTMTYNANDRLRYIGNRVKATNNIDLSKYNGVNTNNLDSIRNSQKLIDQYYRLLQSKYNENGELLEPNKLQFALDLVKKIWTEIDNIRNLTEQIELPDSIENVLAQEHAEVLAQQEKERQQAISDLEKNYAKETRNNSYGFKDILNATKFDENYQGISTQRLEDYRTSVDLLKEAKAEVEANFDASGKLVGNYEEAKKAIQNYKDALTEVKRIQEEITIEGKNSQEANILGDKAYLEKTLGRQAAKGRLWDTDINKINNNYNSLKDNFTEEQITEFNTELEKINKLREQVTQGFDNKGSLIGNPDEISKAIDQYHQAYDVILSIIRLVKQNKAEGNTDTGISKEGKGVIGLFNKSNDKLTDLDTLFNKVGTGEKGGYVYTEEYAQALENAKLKADELKASLEQIDWTDDEQIQTAKQEVKDFEDQIKELNKLNKDMVAKNGAKLARNIAKYMNDNPALSDEAREKLQSYYDLIMNSSEIGAGQLKEIGIAFTEIQAQEEAAGNTGQTFFSMLEGRAKSLLASLATFMSFYRVLGYIREGFGIIKEFDDALAEMQKVSNETLDTLKEFQITTFDLADGIGTDALALQQSVAEFMRLGQSLQEATDSAKSANILLNVSEFTDASEASKALIAMSQAYQDLSNMEIIDVINKLGNDFPISTQGLATALQDGAASLTTAGNSFYEAAALVTAGNRITQDPSKVGKAMRTIALRLTGTEASKAELEEDGEEVEGMITNVSKLRDVIMQATKVSSNGFKGFDILKDNGAYKSTYEILLGIAEIYDEIVENDKKTGAKGANLLLETIAGKVLPEKYGNIFL